MLGHFHHKLHPRKIKSYGWKKDHIDPRDLALHEAFPIATSFPSVFSLRSQQPAIYDQGQLGSCTGNGIARVMQFARQKQKLTPDYVPSRLFIYYGERVIEGTISEDAGAEIRDGLKVVATLGAPPETDWPYDIQKFADQPPQPAYTDALKDLALKYYRLNQSTNHIKTCLTQGFPVVFGFNVYEQFESDQAATTGIITMPNKRASPIGGHCQVIVGYDDHKSADGVTGFWEIANSWGPDWGDQGYDWMPYPYLLDTTLSSDFWSVRLVEA